MHSRKGEIGLDRRSLVLSVRSPPRLPASGRYGSLLRVSEKAIDIGPLTALFHLSVSPNSHSGDISARGWGQVLNGQSSEGQPIEQEEHTVVA